MLPCKFARWTGYGVLITAMFAVAFDSGVPALGRPAEIDALSYVPRGAAAFMHVRVRQFFASSIGKLFVAKLPFENGEVEKELGMHYGLKLADIESITFVWPKLDIPVPVAVYATRTPYDRGALTRALTGNAQGRVETKTTTKTEKINPSDQSKPVEKPVSPPPLPAKDVVKGRGIIVYHVAPQIFFKCENMRQLELYVDLWKRHAVSGPLDSAIAQAKPENVLVAGFVQEGGVNLVLPATMKDYAPLAKADSYSLTFATVDGLSAGVAANFSEERVTAAESAAKKLPELVKHFRRRPPQELDYMNFIVPLLENAKSQRDGKVLHITSTLSIDVVTPVVDRLGEDSKKAAVRKAKTQNLQKIAIAMHNCHDANNGYFPAHAIYSKDGKPLLSWRVAILPYLEAKELYAKFKLDEPWDSEHNKKLIPLIPNVYVSVAGTTPPEKGLTHFQIFVGGGALWEKSSMVRRITAILDGTANTVMVVPATEPVIWTKPDDLEYDPKKPLPKIGIGGQPPYVALFDASVPELPSNLPEKTWRALITIAGNETVDLPKR